MAKTEAAEALLYDPRGHRIQWGDQKPTGMIDGWDHEGVVVGYLTQTGHYQVRTIDGIVPVSIESPHMLTLMDEVDEAAQEDANMPSIAKAAWTIYTDNAGYSAKDLARDQGFTDEPQAISIIRAGLRELVARKIFESNGTIFSLIEGKSKAFKRWHEKQYD